MLFLINTFLGFLIAQIADVLKRNKESDSTPVKFDVIFFIKDNLPKIILSLLLSFSISYLVYLNVEDFGKLLGQEWSVLNNIVYAVIGFAPEIVLQWLKSKYNFLQPNRDLINKD